MSRSRSPSSRALISGSHSSGTRTCPTGRQEEGADHEQQRDSESPVDGRDASPRAAASSNTALPSADVLVSGARRVSDRVRIRHQDPRDHLIVTVPTVRQERPTLLRERQAIVDALADLVVADLRKPRSAPAST